MNEKGKQEMTILSYTQLETHGHELIAYFFPLPLSPPSFHIVGLHVY